MDNGKNVLSRRPVPTCMRYANPKIQILVTDLFYTMNNVIIIKQKWQNE